MTKAEARGVILAALTVMPDEAFSYLVLAAVQGAMTKGALCQIWPDGVGGFRQESRGTIETIRLVADDYLKG